MPRSEGDMGVPCLGVWFTRSAILRSPFLRLAKDSPTAQVLTISFMETVAARPAPSPDSQPFACIVAQEVNRGYSVAKNLERWIELAALAAKEEDPDRMLELVREINQLLEQKERRLRGLPNQPA